MKFLRALFAFLTRLFGSKETASAPTKTLAATTATFRQDEGADAIVMRFEETASQRATEPAESAIEPEFTAHHHHF